MKALIIILLSCSFLCEATIKKAEVTLLPSDGRMTAREWNERVVVLTLLGEARGEGRAGLYAVACVIQRRSWEKRKRPSEICLEKWQFSIWNYGKREADLRPLLRSRHTAYATQLARCLNDNRVSLKDITRGANHYCHIKARPNWIVGRFPVIIIGNHKFYKLP